MKCAIITMSYKDDYRECMLLCESIDRFVPKDVVHYIFVNDEDFKSFKPLANSRRVIMPKSAVLPWWLIRLPIKIFGHHFHVSPFTIPVREWIIQQIVKLAVWEVTNPDIDLFINIDSEFVFMKPFSIEAYMNADGRISVYRKEITDKKSPYIHAHLQFLKAAKRLLGFKETVDKIAPYDLMGGCVSFRRDTLINLCERIGKRHWSRNYKIALMNTWRFSEYYLYALYANLVYDIASEKHFAVDKRIFPYLKYQYFCSKNDVFEKMERILSNPYTQGICFQKKGTRFRNQPGGMISFEDIKTMVYSNWEQTGNI